MEITHLLLTALLLTAGLLAVLLNRLIGATVANGTTLETHLSDLLTEVTAVSAVLSDLQDLTTTLVDNTQEMLDAG